MEEIIPLTSVKGVGPAVARLFAMIGVSTVEDLVLNFPRRYDDYSVVTKITELRPGPVTIRGQIEKITGRYVRRGMHVTEAVAREGDQSVRLVWFNQPYRATSMKPGATYFISGLFELSFQKFAIMNPSTELESDFPVNTARIVPIYRETKGLKSTQIRRVVKECLPAIRSTQETLPHWIVEKHSLMSRAEAIEAMHFPGSPQQLEEATKRLGFEEVFGLTLAALLNKHEAMSESSLQIPFVAKLAT